MYKEKREIIVQKTLVCMKQQREKERRCMSHTHASILGGHRISFTNRSFCVGFLLNIDYRNEYIEYICASECLAAYG